MLNFCQLDPLLQEKSVKPQSTHKACLSWNVFENVVWEMAAILERDPLQYINSLWSGEAIWHHKSLLGCEGEFNIRVCSYQYRHSHYKDKQPFYLYDGKPYTGMCLYWISPGSFMLIKEFHIDGSVQDCSISIANALEILQSCTKPSIYLVLKGPILWAATILLA